VVFMLPMDILRSPAPKAIVQPALFLQLVEILNIVEIFLVEDDQSLQLALARTLSSAGYTVSSHGTAESMLEALALRGEHRQQACILMDVNLGSMNGIDAQKLVRHIDMDIPVILMSAHQDAYNVNQAWRDGASNFLFKPFTPKELLDVLKDALGKKYDAITASAEAPSSLSAELEKQVESLTPRQRQVLALVAAGLTHQQIAEQIGISPRTVKLHRAAMMQRLTCKNVPDLVRFYESCKHVLELPVCTIHG